MRRLGISVVVHIVAVLILTVIFVLFDFDMTTLPGWVLPVTFITGGLTWDIISEIEKTYK